MSTSPPRHPSLIALVSDPYGLRRPLTWVIMLFPGASTLLLGLMLALPATAHRTIMLLAENRMVENLTVVGYLAGCALAIGFALRMRSRGSARAFQGLLVLAAACFGLAGEEVSWGSRSSTSARPRRWSGSTSSMR